VYIQSAKNAHTHTGKLIAFSELLTSVFGVSSFDVVQNVEQYLKAGGLIILKGRMDLRLGQTIMEFKIDLSKELDTAIEEIERYAAILRKNGQKVAECIITDGLKFEVYTINEKAEKVREISFEEATSDQAIMFLDTFLFVGRKVPTADDLNMRFGPGSAIYETVISELTTLFKVIKDPIKFQLWAKNMQLVYGATPPEEAFVSQTYLMILVRLLLAKRLTKGSLPARDALSGKLFNSQGINIIEDDFFSWVLNTLFWSQVKSLLEIITDAFDSYDLEEIDEDIFKEIYQEIVKRGDRHKLGEYYTPEWLAELTLNEAVSFMESKNEQKKFSILDPACGSGTFLTNAISMLKKNGYSLEEIIDNVYGIDLNPLAISIARANYLLALGKLIEKRKGAVFIPVYMADSIKLPIMRKELIHGIAVLAIDVDKGIQLDLPLELALDDDRLKMTLAIFTDILNEYKSNKIKRADGIKAFNSKFEGPKLIKEILEKTLVTIMDLVDADRDSVWVFMMRNIYAPLRLKEKRFDLVIGNPPWISFKFIENSAYKQFIKTEVFKYKLLNPKQTGLFTHLDTSTAFYAKTADIYLTAKGILAFVMPRSVLTAAKQHEAFKKQQTPKMTIIKILDTEKVNPLFNVDACTIIAKKDGSTKYPVEMDVISGNLPEKNLRLKIASKYLTVEKCEYSPVEKENMISPYYSQVLEGASIVPRTLWFIKFIPGTFGLNPDAPAIESLVLPDAKEPWKNIILKGEIESGFIFATVTGKYVLPFKPQLLPIVLPISKTNGKFRILLSQDLRKDGKLKMANWLDLTEAAWKENATETSLKNFPKVMDRVNYHNGLTLQKQKRFFVIYTSSGTHIAAAVMDTQNIKSMKVGNAKIRINGFIADYKTYWFATNDKQEANYLAAILNSNTLDQMIKPHQSRGKFGPRDICRLPFEFNIPQFDESKQLHKQIAVLGVKATKEATKLSKTSRLKLKILLPQMKDIDKKVRTLLKC
jgi:type I restriction-modification system DNA methylase subunit